MLSYIMGPLVGRSLLFSETQDNQSGQRKDITLELYTREADQTCASDVVILRVRLKNVSAQQITLGGDVKPGDGLEVYVEAPKQEWEKAWFYDRAHPATPEEGPVIQPGEVRQRTLLVSFAFKSPGEFKVPEAGMARIKAEYEDAGGKIVSDSLSVDLKDPESAPQLFRTKGWHEYVLNRGGVIKKDGLKPFREFLASGVGGHQRALLAFLIGTNHQQGELVEKSGPVIDGKTGAIRGLTKSEVYVPEHGQAINALSEASKCLDPAIKSESLVRMAECYVALNLKSEAVGCLRKVVASELDSHVRVLRYESLLERLQEEALRQPKKE